MAQRLADLLVGLGLDSAQYTRGLKDAGNEARNFAGATAGSFRQMYGAHDGLLGKLREFQQEQRVQGRMARFYAGELMSIVPAGDAVKGTLQNVLGVMVEGAAGGASFGLALEAVKVAAGLVVEQMHRHEETVKRITSAETELVGVQIQGREDVRNATRTLTEGQKAYRDEVEKLTPRISKMQEEGEKEKATGFGILAYLAMATNSRAQVAKATQEHFEAQERINRAVAAGISAARNYADIQQALKTEQQKAAQVTLAGAAVARDDEKEHAAAAEHVVAQYRLQAEQLGLVKNEWAETDRVVNQINQALAVADERMAHQTPADAAITRQRLNDELAILDIKLKQAAAADRLRQNEREMRLNASGSLDEFSRQFELPQDEATRDASLRAAAEWRRRQEMKGAVEGSDLFKGTEDDLKRQRDHQRELYAAIEEMRREDVISERTAETMKTRIAIAEQEARLSGARQFFGTFASLQYSSVHEIAAVGKAAAIAQATIDGVLAVQKALASAPPPWNFAMAAAVGAVAAVNVAEIASTGFEAGGFTGWGSKSQPAGIVHGQEFVSNAAATSRYRPVLEAMNRGTGAVATGLQVTVNNNAPGVDHEVRQIGPGEVEIIARRVLDTQGPRMVAREMSDHSSRSRQAMGRSTTAGPRRA